MGLAIADIKRFVNDGLTPINALIGAPSDAANKNGSLHAKSAYLVSKIDAMSTKINNIQAGISNIGGEKHYEPNNSDIIFHYQSGSIYYGSLVPNNFYNHAFFSDIFYPKYDGVLKMVFNVTTAKSTSNLHRIVFFNTWEIFNNAKIWDGTGTYLNVSDPNFIFPLNRIKTSLAASHFYNTSNELSYGENNNAANDTLFQSIDYFEAGKNSGNNLPYGSWEFSKEVTCKKGFPVRLMYAPYVFSNPLSFDVRLYGKEVA